ncbi:hypothetical protein F2Q69_00004947 [Brassica cretica]|uniref:Uncharacterized protein n=1 Tax=Brassica cretica TaxID=69181 RepID=A0A8S9NRQ9_BRACR|nr:hypothetical protein F2Q69_00004947 [Brassica cretica]
MDQLSDHEHKDPYGNLLKWLIPLDNTISQQPHSLPPPISSTPDISSSAHKPLLSSGSGSQLFSFVHFRSYSMLPLPAPNTAAVTGPVKSESSKPSFDLEDWNCYSTQTLWNSHKSGTEELLSFRGVPLERDKFFVRCGLEGICIPAKKMEEETFDINSFTADFMGELLNGTETELKSWDFRGGYLRSVVASSTRSRGAEAITNSGDIVEKVGLIDVLMGGVGGVEKLGRDKYIHN